MAVQLVERRAVERAVETPSDTDDLHLQVELVAGAGFEPATFGL